jgi:tetratricopeptide (TPR) repeat protein
MADQQQISLLLQSASKLLDSKKYNEALSVYDTILGLNPNHAVAWNNKGIALFELGRVNEAISAYNRALSNNPHDANSWINKCTALQKLGKHDDAIIACDRALEINSNRENYWNFRGLSLFKLGRYAEALAAFDKALTINPNNAMVKNNREATLKNLRRSTDAIVRKNQTPSKNHISIWYYWGALLLIIVFLGVVFHPGGTSSQTSQQSSSCDSESLLGSIGCNAEQVANQISTTQPTPTITQPEGNQHVLNIINQISSPQPDYYEYCRDNYLGTTYNPSTNTCDLQPTPTIGVLPVSVIVFSTPTITFATLKDPNEITAQKIAQAIDYTNPVTRDFALTLVKKTSSGPYNIEQVCDVWDYCYKNWVYVNDPSGQDYYSPASRTINLGLKGDCDDFAILIAAITESIGGTSRVVTACDSNNACHAYAEVYLGTDFNDVQSTINAIQKRYPIVTLYSRKTQSVSYHYETSPVGITRYWLNLDWSANHPGGPLFTDNGEYCVYYPYGEHICYSDTGYRTLAPMESI